MTFHITRVTPGDVEALHVRCKACGTEVAFRLKDAPPGFVCLGCRAEIHISKAAEAARAIADLQTMPPNSADVSFELKREPALDNEPGLV